MRGSMRATHILRYFPNLYDVQCSHNHITLSFLLTEAHLVQSHFLQKKKKFTTCSLHCSASPSSVLTLFIPFLM